MSLPDVPSVIWSQYVKGSNLRAPCGWCLKGPLVGHFTHCFGSNYHRALRHERVGGLLATPEGSSMQRSHVRFISRARCFPWAVSPQCNAPLRPSPSVKSCSTQFVVARCLPDIQNGGCQSWQSRGSISRPTSGPHVGTEAMFCIADRPWIMDTQRGHICPLRPPPFRPLVIVTDAPSCC